MADTIGLERIAKIWPAISAGNFDQSQYIGFLTHLEDLSAVTSTNTSYATIGLDQTLLLLVQIRELAQANNNNNGPNDPAQLSRLTRQGICIALTGIPRPEGWRSSEQSPIVNSLCLALSLRLGFEISPVRVTHSNPGAVEWRDTSTIAELIRQAFPKPDQAGNPEAPDPQQINLPPQNQLAQQQNLVVQQQNLIAQQQDLIAQPQNHPPQDLAQMQNLIAQQQNLVAQQQTIAQRHVLAPQQNSQHPSPTPQAAQPPQPQPIDLRLTLEYLCTYHNFDVLFVSNLKEHLQIQWSGTHESRPKILIYKHKIFLWNELQFPTDTLLPKDLIEEVLDTLNLLLPHNSYHTAKFLKSNKLHSFYTLGWCGRSPLPLHDLSHYLYYKDRLAELSDIVKGAPTGLPQLKLDRGGRNLMDFVNFWVALLVGVFTIVSIAFGTASLVLSKWQYDLGVLQYRLSLAQACLTPNATSLLQQFC